MSGEIKDRPGLKHRDFKPCALCRKGVMHANDITFYRVRIERFVVDLNAVQRAHGMEMMMGGNAVIANVMGPNEDLAKLFTGPHEILICSSCALRDKTPIAVIEDMIGAVELRPGDDVAPVEGLT